MTDVHDRAQRSANMSAIKGKNTKPEMRIRRLLHGLGYRYSLHRKDLPGRPDLVFTSRRKAIFVHGCFWHMHDCRYGNVVPATNAAFWHEKRSRNVMRDAAQCMTLEQQGWEVLVVWECQTKEADLEARLTSFLGSRHGTTMSRTEPSAVGATRARSLPKRKRRT